MRQHIVAWMFLASLLSASLAGAGSVGPAAVSEVSGVVGLVPALEHSCLATYVEVPEGYALGGLAWYNNDGLAVFPRLLLAEGGEGGPPQLAEATEIVKGLKGESLLWSAIEFPEPVRAAQGGLYVYFEFPPRGVRTGTGMGQGPGLGYVESETGLEAWVSDMGEEWVQVAPEYKLALRPLLVAASADLKCLSKAPPPAEPASQPEVRTEASLTARPNPFNPQTEIRFALAEAAHVQLVIYDLRGAVVKRLAAADFVAGEHSLTWQGEDERGQGVPSGVYIARLRAGKTMMTERMILIR